MDEHPFLGWLSDNQDNVAKLREQGFTKAAAVNALLLFDIASFLCPEVCEECQRKLDTE